jgi:hypothetical protein
LIWMLGFILVYAIRLPVTYQHGRYIMPSMPVGILLGFIGLQSWVKYVEPVSWKRIIGRVWVISCVLTLWGFLIIGARTYANDIALINSEMVAAAKWISENTEIDSVIAAHDIGALGFYGNRAILDLAGLVTPEVIPFIRDETAIAEFLDKRGADYLMTFPNWYPQLVKNGVLVFCTGGGFSPAQGGENMCVYRWQ